MNKVTPTRAASKLRSFFLGMLLISSAAIAQSTNNQEPELVQTLISDMALNNDEALKNHRQFGWARVDLPGFVTGGVDNRQQPHLLPWYTFMEGESNVYSQVSLELRGMQTWVLRNNQWRQVHEHKSFGGAYFPQSGNYFANGQHHYTGDTVPVLPRLNAHGWWGGRIETGTVQAVVIAMQARLIGPDANRARFLMTVGADWYPNRSGPSKVILKGVGVSRAKWVNQDWQWVTMTTLSDTGIQEPGGGISQQQLISNPPPLVVETERSEQPYSN